MQVLSVAVFIGLRLLHAVQGIPQNALGVHGDLVERQRGKAQIGRLLIRRAAADDGYLLCVGVEFEQVPAAAVGKDELMIGDVAGLAHIAVPGVVDMHPRIHRSGPFEAFQLLGFGVDTVEVSGLVHGIDVAVGAQMQTVVEDFRRLAQILDRLVIQTVAVDMAPGEADHVQGVVPRIVAGAVDALAQHGQAEIFGLAGFGVIADDVGAGEALPGVVDMCQRQPGGMPRGAGGVVGRRDDRAVGQEVDRRMQLGMCHLLFIGQQGILRLPAEPVAVRVVIVLDQTGMVPRLLKGGRQVHSAGIGGAVHIPAGAVALLQPIHIRADMEPDAGLIDQPHPLGIVIAAKETCKDLLAHKPFRLHHRKITRFGTNRSMLKVPAVSIPQSALPVNSVWPPGSHILLHCFTPDLFSRERADKKLDF